MLPALSVTKGDPNIHFFLHKKGIDLVLKKEIHLRVGEAYCFINVCENKDIYSTRHGTRTQDRTHNFQVYKHCLITWMCPQTHPTQNWPKSWQNLFQHVTEGGCVSVFCTPWRLGGKPRVRYDTCVGYKKGGIGFRFSQDTWIFATGVDFSDGTNFWLSKAP